MPDSSDEGSPEAWMKKIQSVLSDDLLHPSYKKKARLSPTEGHCYAASEALFYLLGGAAAGLTPCVGSYTHNGVKGTHWWLRTAEKAILDPTAEQFIPLGIEPPYSMGKGSGFLTNKPSKRAQEILDRVQNRHQASLKTDGAVPKQAFRMK